MFFFSPLCAFPLGLATFFFTRKLIYANGNVVVFIPNYTGCILLLVLTWAFLCATVVGLVFIAMGLVRHFTPKELPIEQVIPLAETKVINASRFIASSSLVEETLNWPWEDEPAMREPGKIYMLVNHEKRGPFAYVDILSRMWRNDILPSALACEVGSSEWLPVEDLLKRIGYRCVTCHYNPVASEGLVCRDCKAAAKRVND